MKPSDDVEFVPHPPERRTRSTYLAAGGCCCCCCCCCFHSAGGLIGAIYGSVRRKAPALESLTTNEEIVKESEIARSNRYAARVYWMVLTIIAFLTVVVCMIIEPKELVLGPSIIGVFLPAGQLGASIISWIVIASNPPVRPKECLRRLGKITLWAFVGALIGTIGTVITFNRI